MSKMKELDHIADCVVDIISEHLDHNIAWAIDDTIVDGLKHDDFIDACLLYTSPSPRDS